ncbi:MAG TPA: HAMP domain-containing sensor histidine kinase [Ktedonobacteraceae bacterium]|jgi:two-component system CheB/CheR fusion protein
MSNKRATRFDPGQEAETLLPERYISASVVIDNNWEIVHFRGNTSLYLALPSGKASFHILDMAQRGLVRGLRTAIAHARKKGRPVKRECLQWQNEGQHRRATVEVIPHPVPLSAGTAPFFLVLFSEIPLIDPSRQLESAAPLLLENVAVGGAKHPGELESPHSRTEVLFFLEELQAQNEELQATTEDLRVTNEMLAVSKPELQSAVEELIRVNQELQARNEQLKAAHDYTAALVETLWEPLLVLNDRLQVVQANQAFYLFFHTTTDATENHALAELGEGQWNIPLLLMKLDSIHLSNRDLAHFEVDHTFPVIGHKRIMLSARRIPWGEHETPLILLAFTDVTDRELEKQRQQFLGLATHELKTPITSLKAYTEFLQLTFEQAGDLQSAHLLAKMDDQIERLINLIQELLDATQMEAGQFRLQRTWVSLRKIVQECVEEIQRTTSTHHISIEREVLHPIYADRLRIRQVLLNLLANALKYSPPDGRILVTMDASRDGVIVSVQDFGRGIAPDQHHNLFERFFRVSGDATETYPGLGLGLYIAAQIVHQHEGRIWVESEEGRGATFFCFLPSGPAEREAKDPEASSPPR